MKNLKKIIALVALSLTILSGTAQAADRADGSYKITFIETTTGGWAWVGLDRPTNFYNDGTCSTKSVMLHHNDGNGVLPGNTTEARARVYSAVVSAMLAGKNIKVWVAVNNSATKQCLIERVRIMN